MEKVRAEFSSTETKPRETKSSARRRIIIVLTTLACLFAAEMGVRHYQSLFVVYHSHPYERKREALMQLDPPPDVILLGSSRVKYGLVPDDFAKASGCRVFNLGIAGSKTLEWQWIARECIAPIRPRLVVLGVNASIVRADYLPVPAAQSLFSLSDLAEYMMDDGWSNEVMRNFAYERTARSSSLFYYRYGIRMAIQEQLGFILPKHAQEAIERREFTGRKPPLDGFEHPWLRGQRLKTMDKILEEDASKVFACSVPAYAPDAKAIRHFGDLLDWFQTERIPLVVAYMPNSPRTEERWRAVEPAMHDIIERECVARGVPFVDCPLSEVPRSNSNYFEELHVTLPLAHTLSRRVVERVTALGLLDARQPQLAGTQEPDNPLP